MLLNEWIDITDGRYGTVLDYQYQYFYSDDSPQVELTEDDWKFIEETLGDDYWDDEYE